ncbi:MAG: NAD-dependent epimerase/dehydratase family protein [Candidatus Abyssobacteria bacterium SURF_5]|uniref:NAD-dependent epimerase/dehydratase family protein n=1 Tax=Abyssobacteria bacterium (strain SURF_5) TaxID=2093360 RepID=A0A3A4N734_ABYX5|nr:MAG: NAD-dependent epimerase/dehydratase family protein [Candidatus Abyssubacteria bacterium SURF_5]
MDLSPKHVLIIGGAGFIGSHLVDELMVHGHRVRVLDNLSPQVHGELGTYPCYLNRDAELVIGDVRDADLLNKSLRGIDAVFHFAAAVGVGQSMYQIDTYSSINSTGTAVLLQNLIRFPVAKLIIASSMSIYGEGLYRASDGTVQAGVMRTHDQLKGGQWELIDGDGLPLSPVPTPETKQPSLASIYALTKYDQEQMCLIFGRSYGIPVAALRFFNVYGTRQALSNPYTGVLAIFASRYLNDKPPLIFEDGLQRRDFVSVHDIVRACRLALENTTDESVFNIGSGHSYSVTEVAKAMAKVVGKEDLQPIVTGKYRMGDIRHCFADIERAEKFLGYKPRVTLEQGLDELADWLQGQEAFDGVDLAKMELDKRGLTI